MIFDMDGVLIDSKGLVEACYRRVGIDMPDDAWGRPWHEWLPALCSSMTHARNLHAEKTAIQLSCLRGHKNVPWLPGSNVLLRLDDMGVKVGILTGATFDIGHRIRCHLDRTATHGVQYMMCGQSEAAKTSAIRHLAASSTTCYVDDSPVGKDICGDVARFVQYTGQTTDELMEAIWTP